MAQISISPDLLSDKASILRENADKIKRSVYEIKVINDEFKQSWIGCEINIFQKNLNDCENLSLKELTVLCDDFSNYLERVACEFRSTEEQLLNSFFGEE